ncbi:MAG TPA: ankyrin repeat domain-containing protein, partial [Solirubrobacterales bacterium]|nr:ankyrin repeat domain-containing protein [Solirubrobacterales bacterium]
MPMSTLLIQCGADVEARDDLERTPLIRAAAAGHEGTVRLLLDAGAAFDTRGGTRQRTPLLAAAYFGHLNAVKLLTERGADVNAADRHDENALHFAVGQAAFSNVGAPTLIEYLVANGTDMNAKNNSGLTP